jgi:hypothetical protein
MGSLTSSDLFGLTFCARNQATTESELTKNAATNTSHDDTDSDTPPFIECADSELPDVKSSNVSFASIMDI